MAVSAIFTANFASFFEQVNKAEAEIKDFGESAINVGKTLNRMTDSFSGRRMIQEATVMAKAIEDIGGPSRLTASELQKVAAKAQEAAEKLRLLGKDVPADLQKLANEMKGPLSTAISKIGPAMIAAFSVTAITAAAKKVLDFAGQLTDLSAKTGISTTGLQKLQIGFEQSGVSLDTVTASVTKFQANLIGGDKSAVGALEKLGLSVEDLKRSAPEAAFLEVANAIGKIENPAEKAYAAMKIFGKGGSELLPGLNAELSETVRRAEELGLVISEETVAAADKFGDQLSIMGKQLMALGAQALAPFLPLLTKFGELLLWLGSNVVGPFVNVAIKGLVGGLAILWERLAEMLSRLAAVGAKLPFVGKQFEDLSDWLQKSAVASGKFVDELWNGTIKVAAVTPKATTALWGFGAAAEDSDKAAKKAAAAFEKVSEQITAIEHGAATGFAKLGDVGGYVLPAVSAGALEAAEAIKKLNEQIAKLEAGAGGISAGSVGGRIFDVKDEVKATAASIEQTLGVSLKGLFSGGSLTDVFQSAFEGGGNVAGAIRSFATKALSTGLSFIPGIGPALAKFAGPIVAGVEKIFGGLFRNKEVEQVNDLRDAFEDTFGTLEDMHKAFNAVGLDVQTVLKADTVEEFNAVLKEYEQRVKAVGDAFAEVEEASAKTFGVMPEHMKPAVQALLDMGALTEDQRAKLQALLDGTATDFAGLTKLAEGYGISLEQLGPKFQQAGLDKTAQQYARDFEILSAAGADVNGLLVGMQDEVQTLLNNLAKFGGSVPDSMKPLLEAMVASGLLVDENGEKLRDLTGIKFSESPLEKGLKDLDKTIQDLIATLGGVPGAIDKIARTPVPRIDIPVAFTQQGGFRPDLSGFGNIPMPSVGHMGGFVTAQGIQRHHKGVSKVLPFVRRMHSGGLAGDEVPAILQTGEAVLNRKAASTLGRSTIDDINSGRMGGGVIEIHHVSYLDGEVVASSVDRRLMNRLKVKSRLSVA